MKKQTTIFLFPFLFLIFLISCAENKTEENAPSIAELIERNDKIKMDKEWDYIQNKYQESKLAINKNSDDFNAKLELAELFIREARVTGEHGHYYPAALDLTNYVADNSESKDLIYQSLVTKSGVQLSLHEFRNALTTAKKALALNNTSAQIYGVLVDCYVELGDYENAISMADRMNSIKPDIRSYSRISYVRELHGDLAGAEYALSLAIKSGVPGYEETAWAMLTLGELYIAQNKYDKALGLFDQILATRPNYPFAIAAKAKVEFKKGNILKSEELLNEAAAIIPEVGFYVQLAEIYKDQNRTEEFDKIMKEIFVMLEEDVASGHNMNLEYAHIYKDLLQDYDQAYNYAFLEWNKRPENSSVNLTMSQIELLRNNKADAKRYHDISAVINPENPDLKLISAAL